MSLLKVTKDQKRSLAVATVLAVVVGIWFLKGYLILIAVAAIVAYLFTPLYNWLRSHGRSEGQAGVITFFATLLAVIVPVFIVVSVTVLQVGSLVNDISTENYSTNMSEFLNNSVDNVNNLLDRLGITAQLTTQQVTETISTSIETFSKTIATNIISSISGVFAAITTAIIYIYVFMSLLINKDRLRKSLSKLNPLGQEVSYLYFDRMGSMTKATVRGQFIIALCQGLESAFILSIAGLNDLFFFFALLLTVLSIIPLGAGIVTIPIGIVMILTGNVWGGALVIANHLLVVTNIDNVMRPRLVPKEARLDSALMMLSVFSGLAYFGFVGIVLGPVLMIVIVTTIQMFMEVYRDTASLSKKGSLDKPDKNILRSIYKKISRA
jgi:predicted PurR-regulated permease PerM